MTDFDPNNLSWLSLCAVVLVKALPWLGEELRAWRLLVEQLVRAKFGVKDEGQ